MFEQSTFSVVATPASSILIRSSKEKKTKNKNKKQPLCPVTVLVDSQVSDRCPWSLVDEAFLLTHYIMGKMKVADFFFSLQIFEFCFCRNVYWVVRYFSFI